MKIYTVVAAASTILVCAAMAKDKVVVVPAHPDDLIPCFGTCLKSKDIFEWHVIEFTHGERGLGEQGYRDGSARKIRMEEEGAVCRELGAQLHWLDEIDGEAYACRETCEKLAALLKELKPRAVFAHWPVDIHGDHAMAGVAVQKALFLAGLSPEVYFIEQEYQAKRFVPDQFVDITDVIDRKCELIRMYKCQYRDGGIERRKCAIAKANGMHSMLLADGYAEGFMSFVQPLQGQCKTIFQELPPTKSCGTLRFQGFSPPRPAMPVHAPWPSREQEKRSQIAMSGGKIDIVFVGDSITHGWENEGRGKSLYDELCKTYSILNLGYSGQRTENMVWRLENGELDGYRARLFMVMAGTNNSEPAEEVAIGVRRILDIIRSRQSQAKILLLPIFPRGKSAEDVRNVKNAKVNAVIRGFADDVNIIWCDFTSQLRDSAGGMSSDLSSDRLHMNEAGYAIWLDHVMPHFQRVCGK